MRAIFLVSYDSVTLFAYNLHMDVGDNSHVTLRGNVQDYVNAVYVNVCYIMSNDCITEKNYAIVLQGYQQRHAYIIAQSPSDSTVTNFWKMIYERNCGVIVMLCSLTENGEVCAYFDVVFACFCCNWSIYRALYIAIIYILIHS